MAGREEGGGGEAEVASTTEVRDINSIVVRRLNGTAHGAFRWQHSKKTMAMNCCGQLATDQWQELTVG